MLAFLKSLSLVNAIAPDLASALAALNCAVEYFCLIRSRLITRTLSETSAILLPLLSPVPDQPLYLCDTQTWSSLPFLPSYATTPLNGRDTNITPL